MSAQASRPWAFSRGPWPALVVLGAPSREAARRTAQGSTSRPVVALREVPKSALPVAWRPSCPTSTCATAGPSGRCKCWEA